jgi:phage-related protein
MDEVLQDVIWLGDSLQVLRNFPTGIKAIMGGEIFRLQVGAVPRNFDSMVTVGRGVRELRARDRSGQYRAIYVVRKREGIFILHAFQKKSRQTSKRDIEIARKRLRDI